MKKIIYEAYCNEIANDKFGKTLVKSNRKYSEFFYFKNYKILNLSNKKYLFFYIFSILYIHIWLISLFYFTIQFFISIFIFNKGRIMLGNIAFIDSEKSKYDIGLVKIESASCLKRNFFDISSYLPLYGKYLAYKDAINVVFLICKNKKNIPQMEYNSLKLHIYDLYIVSLYGELLKNKKINFFTNSHYDRWSYIASKMDNISLNLIQHGFLTDKINFPFKFGSIDTLYIYDNKFINLFQKYYYSIKSTKIVKTNLKLRNVGNKGEYNTIFIASSMISVDLEKNIINWLLEHRYSVYIKLHPAYNYKDKFNEFDGSINFIDYFPKVDIMICYNSFLGYEYKTLGEHVVWIMEYEDNLDMLYREIERICAE